MMNLCQNCNIEPPLTQKTKYCSSCLSKLHIKNLSKLKSNQKADYIKLNLFFFEQLFQTNEQKVVFKSLLETA